MISKKKIGITAIILATHCASLKNIGGSGGNPIFAGGKGEKVSEINREIHWVEKIQRISRKKSFVIEKPECPERLKEDAALKVKRK